MGPIVEVEGLRFSFDGRREVLRGVSFRAEEGESLAVLGPNGSGKSTLLWCLLGLLRCQGTVKMFGKPRTRASLHQVGVVFQNPEDQLFMPRLLEDVSLPLVNHGVPPEEARARALALLREAGLEHAADRPASQLSLGERKKAAIAAALASSPRLLILDEPTAELDGRSSRLLAEHLRKLPVTCIVATHDLELARKVCQKAVILFSGEVLAEGPARELLGDLPLLERAGLV